MKKELKQKWIVALRSGEYKQVPSALELREDDKIIGNCCLGVLCRVADTQIINDRIQPDESGDDMLSSETIEKVGISQTEQNVLIEMNDDLGNSFSEIADWIEAHVN